MSYQDDWSATQARIARVEQRLEETKHLLRVLAIVTGAAVVLLAWPG